MIKKATAILLCIVMALGMMGFSSTEIKTELLGNDESDAYVFTEEIEMIPVDETEILELLNENNGGLTGVANIEKNIKKELDDTFVDIISNDKLLNNYEYEKLNVVPAEDAPESTEPISMAVYYNDREIMVTSLFVEDFIFENYSEIELSISQKESKELTFNDIITKGNQKIVLNDICMDKDYLISLTINDGYDVIQYNGSFKIFEKEESLAYTYSIAKVSFTESAQIQQELQKLEALSREPAYIRAVELRAEQKMPTDEAFLLEKFISDNGASKSSTYPYYEVESNDSMNIANLIFEGEIVYGRISTSSDQDYYKIRFQQEGVVDFSLLDIPSGRDYDLRIYDGSGNRIASSATTSSSEVISNLQVRANEYYYIHVYGYNGSYTNSSYYRIIIDYKADDFGNSFSTAYAIYTNVGYSGRINYGGDNDYFKFVAPRAGSYVITTTGGTDTYGYLYNSNQSLLSENDDAATGNLNFKIVHNLSANQTYYVRVKAYNTNATGTYTLRVEEPLKDDHGDTFSTATTISVDRNYICDIDYAGDNDFFRFIAPRTGTYIVETTGNAIDTYGYLYNSSQSLLREDDDSGSGGNFRITYNLTANQTYYIRARAYSLNTVGRYTLCVTAPANVTDDYGNTQSTAFTINTNTNYSGKIDYQYDEDCFKFTAPSSGTYRMYTTGSTNTYGALRDSNFSMLRHQGTAGSNFDFTYSLIANQVYYLVVDGYSGSVTGNYVLRVDAPNNVPNNTSLRWPIDSREVTLWFGELDHLDSTVNHGIDIQQASGYSIYSICDGVVDTRFWNPDVGYGMSVNYRLNNQFYQVRYIIGENNFLSAVNGNVFSKGEWIGAMSVVEGKYLLNLRILRSTNNQQVRTDLANAEYVNPLQFFSEVQPNKSYLYYPMSVSFPTGTPTRSMSVHSEYLYANSFEELEIMKAAYIANKSANELADKASGVSAKSSLISTPSSRFAFNLDLLSSKKEVYLARAVLHEAQKQNPSLTLTDLSTNGILTWNPFTREATVVLNGITKVYSPYDAAEYYTHIENDRIVITQNKFDVDFAPPRSISIKLYGDQSYQQEFPGVAASNASNVMIKASEAFKNRWNIDFVVSVSNLSSTETLPLDSCPQGYNTACTDQNCGTSHHKDGDRNLEFFRSTYFEERFDLGVLLTSSNFCVDRTAGHSVGVYGLAYPSGRQSILNYSSTFDSLLFANALTRNARITQHEISHNFGAQDGYNGGHCNVNQDCIMDRGWDLNANFNNKTIWCDVCEQEFNRDLH